MFSNFDFDVIYRSLPYLFYDGMTFTLTLTAMAAALGLAWGTVLALMRLSGFPPLVLFATGYVNLMRSVPLVLMIVWFYFLVPYIGQWITGSSSPRSVLPATSTGRLSVTRKKRSTRSGPRFGIGALCRASNLRLPVMMIFAGSTPSAVRRRDASSPCTQKRVTSASTRRNQGATSR